MKDRIARYLSDHAPRDASMMGSNRYRTLYTILAIGAAIVLAIGVYFASVDEANPPTPPSSPATTTP